MMSKKTILYISGSMTASQESFVKANKAEVRNQFIANDDEKDYDHVFVRKEVPGFRDCDNAILISTSKVSDEEAVAPKTSPKKKAPKKVDKD